jgi:Membrane protein involved in the export of O-antigen and teichoic acid
MDEAVSNRKKFIWNMLGGLSSSGLSLILSIAVNRMLGGTYGGIFAFAYANAQLMYTIGAFEVRPFQATDVNEKYNFNSYFSFRIFSCFLMVTVSVIYIVLNRFTLEKSLVILFLVLFKVTEAVSDVYGGRFQQKDRIDLSGKLYFVRVAVSMSVFILIAAVLHNLTMAAFGMFFSSVCLFFIYDYKFVFPEDRKGIKIETDKLFSLFKEVLPLFIGAFIMMYISNAPKYAIDAFYSDDIQNIYNILFMPAFVINMFSIFVFRPMLVGMAVDWNLRNMKKLWAVLIKIYGVILGLTVVALAGTWITGIPVLSVLYGVNLSEYKSHLMLVMVTGGISALLTFSCQIITIMRKQKVLLLGYCTAFLYAYVASRLMVRSLGIGGAILAYGTSMGLLVLACLVIIITANIRRGRENENKEINLYR